MFATLSRNLVNGLPTSTNVFGIDSVNAYYTNLNVQNKSFHLQSTSYEIILKYGAAVLCNLSITLSKFPEKSKIALIKPLYKKDLN